MLTDEEFRLFRNLIHEQSGIFLKDTRKDFLENRLVKRIQATGMSSPYWYYKLVTEKQRAELLVLLDLMTVNETSFFRNGPQLELFRNTLLPNVIEENRRGVRKRLRIWSAGCSTGEEPYTIAMIILDALPDIAGWDVRIIASDLSMKVLAAAKEGVYSAEKVHATVDDRSVDRYFVPRGDRLAIRDEVKRLVAFDYHNLKNDNGQSGLDVILCRNVMIYFNEDEQTRLVRKFYQSLRPGGYLLIGHAESLQGTGSRFEFVYERKGTAYRKPMEVEQCVS